jgi:hypothetical protein
MTQVLEQIARLINGLTKRVEALETIEAGRWVDLSTPLTSTSWDGDSYGTVGKTKIDLSAVFSVPAGVKAIGVEVDIRDSGSSGADCTLLLSPNDTDYEGIYTRCSGLANDSYASHCFRVPCNVDGDVYYQILASGAGTPMDVYIRIWGYAK